TKVVSESCLRARKGVHLNLFEEASQATVYAVMEGCGTRREKSGRNSGTFPWNRVSH
ncbi:unnamed protein product, partial [Gulo gulo]